MTMTKRLLAVLHHERKGLTGQPRRTPSAPHVFNVERPLSAALLAAPGR